MLKDSPLFVVDMGDWLLESSVWSCMFKSMVHQCTRWIQSGVSSLHGCTLASLPCPGVRAAILTCCRLVTGDPPSAPTALCDFELLTSRNLCLVNSSGCSQFDASQVDLLVAVPGEMLLGCLCCCFNNSVALGCDTSAHMNRFECGAAEIPAHVRRDHALPHFSAHPIVCGVCCRWAEDVQVLIEEKALKLRRHWLLLAPKSCSGTIHHKAPIIAFEAGFMNLQVHGPNFWAVSMLAKSLNSGSATDSNEQDYSNIYSCIRFSLLDDAHAEVAVTLFGLNHWRGLTTSLLLVLRFNSGDTLSLSSVRLLQYLQLNTPQPQVHMLDRPSGEPPAGHQLVWSMEAFRDYNCGIVESELSTDDRAPFGSTCSLLRLLQELSSSCSLLVQLSSLVPCSNLKSHVLMYCDP